MSGAKKGRTEAQRIAAAIKSYKVQYYGIDAAAEALAKAVPDCAFMLLAAGVHKLHAVAVIPENKREGLSAADWVTSAVSVWPGQTVEGDAAKAYTTVEGNPEQDLFPLKMKDTARGQAFALLKSKSLVEDESDDEEPDFSAYDF